MLRNVGGDGKTCITNCGNKTRDFSGMLRIREEISGAEVRRKQNFIALAEDRSKKYETRKR